MTDAAESTTTALRPPIPGEPIDPPPRPIHHSIRKADDHHAVTGTAYRAFIRFTHANGTLLAAGTTYYAFLAVFAMLVFAFGLTALIGGADLADFITESVSNAFPGLIGDQGISPSTLEDVAQTTSVVGLLILLVSGSGAMVATSGSMHLIYGAPKDPRNFVLARLRLLGWLLLLAPLIALSFIPSALTSHFAEPILKYLGLSGGLWSALLVALTLTVSVGLNALVAWLILGHLGGIKPARGPRMTGTAIAAVGIEVLKYLLNAIISWSVSKPQFGAFAAPIAMLLVLYLETMVLYAAASVTAGMAAVRTPA
jgi:membrane protein